MIGGCQALRKDYIMDKYKNKWHHCVYAIMCFVCSAIQVYLACFRPFIHQPAILYYIVALLFFVIGVKEFYIFFKKEINKK